MEDGPQTRIIGVHGNKTVKLDYVPSAYIDAVNTPLNSAPSLYDYQLNKRIVN